MLILFTTKVTFDDIGVGKQETVLRSVLIVSSLSSPSIIAF